MARMEERMDIVVNVMPYIKAFGPVAIGILNAFLFWRWRKRLDQKLSYVIALLKAPRGK